MFFAPSSLIASSLLAMSTITLFIIHAPALNVFLNMLRMGLISRFVGDTREKEGKNEPWVASQVKVGFWAV